MLIWVECSVCKKEEVQVDVGKDKSKVMCNTCWWEWLNSPDIDEGLA